MKGRKYLRRLTIVILFGVLIPALTAFALFCKRTQESNEQSTEKAYYRAFSVCTSLLDRKIQELEYYSARISAESRDYGSLLQNGFGAMDEYRIYLLTQELSQRYLRTDVADWGIYSYDHQRIITSDYSCTLNDFLFKYTGETGIDSPLADFFAEDRYRFRDTMFATTGTDTVQNRYCVVGFCTQIGHTNDQAMVFYVLSPTNVKDSMVMVEDQGIAYYLLDQDGNALLSWGDFPEGNADTALQQTEWKQTMGVPKRVRYNIKSRYPALMLSAYVWDKPLQSAYMELIDGMWLMLVGLVVLILIVSGMAIYASYKPIQDLTKNFDYKGGSEFELILNKMSDKASKIDEQQELIITLLMNHLLFGIPISTEQIEHLGVTGNIQYYCVFLMDGYSFVDSKMLKQLTNEIKRSCKARIFVTDWYEGNCDVLVCFMEQPDTTALEEKLNSWLQANCSAAGVLYVGPTCDQLNNIQQSFRSCVEERRKKQQKNSAEAETIPPRRMKQKKILQQIVSYLEDNFRNAGISQVQVADQFQISNYTLSRMFKNEMGIGFAEYLSAKRLEYAKELLITTNYPIREIALMSGFTNENYFSRTFKLYTGTVPSTFRKQ